MKIPNERVQPRPSSPPESLHNILYHSHLHLTSQPPPTSSSSSSPKSSPSYSSSSSSTTTTPPKMVPHIASLASDAIQVHTASTIQYHRPQLPPSCSNDVARRPMRHLRHPSNLPLYTCSIQPTNNNRNRRLRDTLKPLFHIFTPHDSGAAPPEKHWDSSRKAGSKAKVLQEASVNRQQRDSRGSSLKESQPLEKPTRYFRREQSNAAIVEELKCEGLLGGGVSKKGKKRKGRDSPDLEKPLPPLVPSMTRRNSEEKYWAGVADDIARRVSMLN